MGNPIYIETLKKNKERYEKFLHYQKLGLITEFDDEVLNRLRNIYWGRFYQALLYIFFEPTDDMTIGNKVELLCKALEDKRFRIGHVLTKTVSEIDYSEFNQKPLKSNSFVERQSINGIWIYDFLALLRFDRDVYKELEIQHSSLSEQNILKMPSSDFVDKEKLNRLKEVLQIDDTYDFGIPDFFINVIMMVERKIEGHPYQEMLEKEINTLKSKHKYKKLRKESILLDRTDGIFRIL